MIELVPWITGKCSFYAIAHDGVVLADRFLEELALVDRAHAERLANLVGNIVEHAEYVRPALLRTELPAYGIYALYNHKEVRSPYNPSRLLCAYAAGTARIVIVGAGFIKERTEPIQQNARAMQAATTLASCIRIVNDRIKTGEIDVDGSILYPSHPEAFTLHHP